LKPTKPYDYIITGGGCAGLSLVMRMLKSKALKNKRILLIEKDGVKTNDRTWCFWEKGNGAFEDIVYKKWDHAWFHGEWYSSLKNLSPYQYKMIRGIDFYTHCHQEIGKSDQLVILNEEVVSIENIEHGACVKTDQGVYQGKYVFNSIQFQQPVKQKNRVYLLQHFKGWIIETEEPMFNPAEATLMDFRVDQTHGTTFVYVMPFSETRALVEYTLFTPSLLNDTEYDQAILQYVEKQLSIEKYKVLEKEFGVIPMTDHVFPSKDGNIVFLGTSGGQTKPSSGYTYRFIQKHVDAIVSRLEKKGDPFTGNKSFEKRFLLYDRILLNILFKRTLEGKNIFSLLFKRNRINRLFAFLDNESSPWQELFLLNTLPRLPFIKSGMELFRNMLVNK
jgi:lycopene beta-cyclase